MFFALYDLGQWPRSMSGLYQFIGYSSCYNIFKRKVGKERGPHLVLRYMYMEDRTVHHLISKKYGEYMQPIMLLMSWIMYIFLSYVINYN